MNTTNFKGYSYQGEVQLQNVKYVSSVSIHHISICSLTTSSVVPENSGKTQGTTREVLFPENHDIVATDMSVHAHYNTTHTRAGFLGIVGAIM